jgi:hypothetical protein
MLVFDLYDSVGKDLLHSHQINDFLKDLYGDKIFLNKEAVWYT